MPEPLGLAVEDVRFSFELGPEVLAGVGVEVAPGEVLSLLGPSGCGKTTLLRVIAGLEVPSSGRVSVGGRELTGGGRLVAPEKRRIGMVFQDWALFPHLSVADNVAFGLPRAQRRSADGVAETLLLVGLEGLGDRMPSTLSGGQQQRVALGRALAQRPEALLLDEPFSNLDSSLRVRVRTDVHRLLAEIGTTTVIVTHDRDEAFVLGDRVALMREGSICQEGPAEHLYRRPVDEWAARFLGDVVMLAADARGSEAMTELGVLNLREPASGAVQVMLRPEQLRLARAETSPGPGEDPVVNDAPAHVSATVELIEYHGPHTGYEVSACGIRVRVDVPGPPLWKVGERVALHLPAEPVRSFSGTDPAQAPSTR